MHVILINPVFSDHLSYVILFQCSFGWSLKTGSILLSLNLICVRFPYVHHSYVPFLLNGYRLSGITFNNISVILVRFVDEMNQCDKRKTLICCKSMIKTFGRAMNQQSTASMLTITKLSSFVSVKNRKGWTETVCIIHIYRGYTYVVSVCQLLLVIAVCIHYELSVCIYHSKLATSFSTHKKKQHFSYIVVFCFTNQEETNKSPSGACNPSLDFNLTSKFYRKISDDAFFLAI